MSGTAFRRKPSFYCLRSGEPYQFDWSHETIEYCASGGREGRADAAVFVRAHFRETQEMVFDAHDRAFAFYGGVSAAGASTTTRRRRWRPSSSVEPASITGGCRGSVRIISSSRSPARQSRFSSAQPAVTPTTDAKARCPSPPRRCPTDSQPKQPRLARREKASDRRVVIPGCL